MRTFRISTVLFVLLVFSAAFAKAPALIPVQGTLLDSDGHPVEETAELEFAIYDSFTGGDPLWSETQLDVPVVNGLFTAYLGDVTLLNLDMFAEHTELFLGVTVRGEEEMEPRIQFGTTPYAAFAEKAGDAFTLSGMMASEFARSFEVGDGLDLTDGVLSSTVEAGDIDYDDLDDRYAAADHDHEGQYLPNITCDDGYVLKAVDGGWDCAQEQDTQYSAGTGLSRSGTVLSADTTYVQRRVQDGCQAGYSIREIHEDGSVLCQPDSGNTTYTAGTGLTLTGTQFAANPAEVQSRVEDGCAAGYSIREIDQDGTVTCQPDTTYTAGAGLILRDDNEFAVDSAEVQRRVDPCGTGFAIREIRENGTVICQRASSGIEVIEDVSATNDNATRTLYIDCPTGKVPYGGGYRIEAANNSGIVDVITPTNRPVGNRWHVIAHTAEFNPGYEWRILGYVICGY